MKVMKTKEYILRSPTIIHNVDLGDSRDLERKNVYIAKEKGEKTYIGMYLGQAFVYLDEDGIHRIYFRLVSGIRNLYRDNKYLIPIHGFPRSVIYTYPLTSLVIVEEKDRETLIVLHEKKKVYEFRSIEKGLFSKKICYSNNIALGFAGDTIYATVRMSNEHKCKDVLVLGKLSGKFSYREYERLIPMNWNGQWYSYINVKSNKIEHYINLYNGDVVKISIDKDVYGTNFIRKDNVIHYSRRNNSLVLFNGREVKVIDIKRKDVLWQKIFGPAIYSQTHDMFLDRIVVYDDYTVYVLSIDNGRIEFKHSFNDKITATAITRDYLVVAAGEKLYVYVRREQGYFEYGKYVLPGEIVNLHIHGDDMIIAYRMPGNIVKVMHVSLMNPIEIRLKDLTIITNTAVELPVERYKADVKLLKSNSPYIKVVKHKGKTALADLGSTPGTYNVTLQLSIPERLPIVFDLGVKIEGLERAFRKLSIPNKPVYSPRGAYIPVTIVTDTPLDELYMVLTSRDGTIYGSSPVLSNIPQGEFIVPLYIAWAKSGRRDIELNIIGWSKRNRIYQKFSAQLIIERDIPPLYSRFYSDTLYIWSPFNIETAEIIARSKDTSVNIRQSMRKGWNEIETIKGGQEEILIILPTRVRCVIRRGKSWIEFLR